MSRYEGSGFRGKAKDKMFGLVCIRCLAWSEHRSSGHEKFRYLSSVSQVSLSLSLSLPLHIYIYMYKQYVYIYVCTYMYSHISTYLHTDVYTCICDIMSYIKYVESKHAR